MRSTFVRAAQGLLARFDLRLTSIPADGAALPPDLPDEVRRIVGDVAPYTMTSAERVFALYEAIQYVERRRVPGAIVECGVWRGGSMMVAAKTLLALGSTQRELVLFDSFEGMTAPTEADVKYDGTPADDLLARTPRLEGGKNVWCWASEEDVRHNMDSTGYPADRVRLVPGRVEVTIPGAAPERIALLRLDTDWYESTAHELRHLVPRLSPGGVLIVDDYGHWKGARQAVDEYFAAFDPPVLLHRIDYTGRLAVIERPATVAAG